jgi:hypothetical protein
MLAGFAKTAAKLAKSSRQDVVAVSMLVAAKLLQVLRQFTIDCGGVWHRGLAVRVNFFGLVKDSSPWPCRAQGQVSASLWVLPRITSAYQVAEYWRAGQLKAPATSRSRGYA